MYLVLDTETTGLPANFSAPITDSDNWPRLVELAWGVYSESGEVRSTGQLLVRPEGFAISSAAVEVHGITTEKAKAEGIDLAEALEQLVNASANCRYLVGHNLEYDLAIVGAELHRLKWTTFEEGKQLVCTMRMGTALPSSKQGSKPPKLHELYTTLFGEELMCAHRAGADVAACARCLFALLQQGVAYKAPQWPIQPVTPNVKPVLPALDLDNREFLLALNLIENTNRSVFLTGKAGTGKSTFLHHIVAHTRKKAIVIAPTGVAALNSGGMTIHKMFSLPLGIMQPNDYRIPFFGPQRDTGECLNRDRYDLLQAVELVIIDEVSMVRADILDAVDRGLRRNSQRSGEPFGGKQLLLVGDAYQLPPVLVPADKQLYERFYKTRYFFGARVFARFSLISLELQKVYRQQDSHFIGLLDRVRTNGVNEVDIQALNKRLTDAPKAAGRGITLSTRNKDAEDYNANELIKLITPLAKFTATVTGDFAESDFPTARELMLKEGAQVMFVRNDRNSRWVNGTIGRIVKLEKNIVQVETERGTTYIVEAETWDKCAYGYDEEKRRIESQVVGTFTQIPLKLAWALTVHKSQGLTFDTVEINAPGGFFDAGQLYVALSRCRSFEGLQLRTAVRLRDVQVSQEVIALHRSANNEQQIAAALEEARPTKLYQQSIVLLNRGNIAEAVAAFCEALGLRNDAQKPLFSRLLRRKLYSYVKAKQELAKLTVEHGKLLAADLLKDAEQVARIAREEIEKAELKLKIEAIQGQLMAEVKQYNSSKTKWQLEQKQLHQQVVDSNQLLAGQCQQYKELQAEKENTRISHINQLSQDKQINQTIMDKVYKNLVELQIKLNDADKLVKWLRGQILEKDLANKQLKADFEREQARNRTWWRKLRDKL